jgi:hypothetical protein
MNNAMSLRKTSELKKKEGLEGGLRKNRVRVRLLITNIKEVSVTRSN